MLQQAIFDGDVDGAIDRRPRDDAGNRRPLSLTPAAAPPFTGAAAFPRHLYPAPGRTLA